MIGQNWKSCYPLMGLLNVIITVTLLAGIIGTSIHTYQQDIQWNSILSQGERKLTEAFNLSEDIHFQYSKDKPFPTYSDDYVMAAKRSQDADSLVREQVNLHHDLLEREIWKQTIHLLIAFISMISVIINFVLSHFYFQDDRGPKINLLYFIILSIGILVGIFFNMFSIRDIDTGYKEIKLISRRVLIYMANVQDNDVSDLIHVCEIRAFSNPDYNHGNITDLEDRIKERKICHDIKLKLITSEIQIGLLTIVLAYTTYCFIFLKWCYNKYRITPETALLMELNKIDQEDHLRKLSTVSNLEYQSQSGLISSSWKKHNTRHRSEDGSPTTGQSPFRLRSTESLPINLESRNQKKLSSTSSSPS